MQLLCLLPPNHLYTAVLNLKTDLFRKSGLASFLALPPLVILNHGTAPIVKPALKRWSLSARTYLTLCPTAVRDTELGTRHWYLPLTPAEALQPLHDAFRQTAALISGFPPPFDGVYLGTDAGKSGAEWAADSVPETKQKLSWNKGRVACLSLKTDQEAVEGGVWWESLEWEQNWSLKIRPV